MRVNLLTCTGDRLKSFALVERWIKRQTIAPDRWIVVDDGPVPVTCTAGQVHIRREPAKQPQSHLFPGNIGDGMPRSLRIGLEAIGGCADDDIVLFVEDDDWYGPEYVETMKLWASAGNDIFGEALNYYYHMGKWKYSRGEWADVYRNHGRVNTALCRTGMRVSTMRALPSFFLAADCPYLDCRLWGWKYFKRGKKLAIKHDGKPIVVGMKGGPGRKGYSQGHDSTCRSYIQDEGRETLRSWIGDEDTEAYIGLMEER